MATAGAARATVDEAVERLFGSRTRQTHVLAPMVRAGTLPLRLLAAAHGADAVYTEEIIDHKMLKTIREDNTDTGITTFWIKKDPTKIAFRTCELERERVVFQLGTASAERAVRVAESVADVVAAFDINMGCPKSFSVKGGMGAALLKKPEVAEDIIKTLRRNITGIPITCKIRLLDTDERSVELVRRLEAAGAQAIGVHMRETHHRPAERAKWDRLQPLVNAVSVPIIANGDVFRRADGVAIMAKSGASSAMYARGGLRNPSLFVPLGQKEIELEAIMRDYVRVSKLVDNVIPNTVYTLSQMMRYNPDSTYRGKAFERAVKQPRPEYEDLLEVFGLTEEECTLGPKERLTWEKLRLTRSLPVVPASAGPSAGQPAATERCEHGKRVEPPHEDSLAAADDSLAAADDSLAADDSGRPTKIRKQEP